MALQCSSYAHEAEYCNVEQRGARAEQMCNTIAVTWAGSAADLAPSYDSRQMSQIHKGAHPLALPGSHMAEHNLAWLNDMLCAPANQATENAPSLPKSSTPQLQSGGD